MIESNKNIVSRTENGVYLVKKSQPPWSFPGALFRGHSVQKSPWRQEDLRGGPDHNGTNLGVTQIRNFASGTKALPLSDLSPYPHRPSPQSLFTTSSSPLLTRLGSLILMHVAPKQLALAALSLFIPCSLTFAAESTVKRQATTCNGQAEV